MKNILSIDRGTRYIGLAHYNIQSKMVMPVGSLMNDHSTLYNIGDIIGRYKIGVIAIGYPKQEGPMQKRVDAVIKQLGFLDERIVIVKVDEEYSSVQASAKTGTYKKNESEDTVAAMYILENYLSFLKEKE